MDFKQLIDDDRAVSPVIGVILMVAITVILAAVIGTFVLGLGDQVQQTTPQAQFGFEQGDLDGDADGMDVKITHETGDTIDSTDLQVKFDGTASNTQFSSTVSAGSSITVNEDDTAVTPAEGQVVRVIYNSPDSDNSATLASREL